MQQFYRRLVPATPMLCTCQPRTPALFHQTANPGDVVTQEQPVKEDTEWPHAVPVTPRTVIEISTTSESSTSSSGSEKVMSNEEQETNWANANELPKQVGAMDILLRNKQSKIVHCCPGIASDAQWEIMNCHLTKCGRTIDSRFEIVVVIRD